MTRLFTDNQPANWSHRRTEPVYSTGQTGAPFEVSLRRRIVSSLKRLPASARQALVLLGLQQCLGGNDAIKRTGWRCQIHIEAFEADIGEPQRVRPLLR